MFDWSLNAFMLLVGYLPCKRKEKPFQKTHFWNDLNCVKWDVKPYSLTSNITLQIIVHSSEWHICITSENIIHRQQSCCQGRLPVYLQRKPFFFWYWDQGGLLPLFESATLITLGHNEMFCMIKAQLCCRSFAVVYWKIYWDCFFSKPV